MEEGGVIPAITKIIVWRYVAAVIITIGKEKRQVNIGTT